MHEHHASLVNGSEDSFYGFRVKALSASSEGRSRGRQETGARGETMAEGEGEREGKKKAAIFLPSPILPPPSPSGLVYPPAQRSDEDGCGTGSFPLRPTSLTWTSERRRIEWKYQPRPTGLYINENFPFIRLYRENA